MKCAWCKAPILPGQFAFWYSGKPLCSPVCKRRQIEVEKTKINYRRTSKSRR